MLIYVTGERVRVSVKKMSVLLCGPLRTGVTSYTMCTSDININSQMSKEKRYILVRDAARIDYFIQRIIPTEDTHALSHVFAEIPSPSCRRYGTRKIASLMDAKPEISEICDALRYKRNDKRNKKIERIHGAPLNFISGSFINGSKRIIFLTIHLQPTHLVAIFFI